MHLRRAALLAVAALVLAATPSFADLVIKLRNGQVITVPVQPGDIESLNFTGPRAAASGAAAPIALPNMQPPPSRLRLSMRRAAAPTRLPAPSPFRR